MFAGIVDVFGSATTIFANTVDAIGFNSIDLTPARLSIPVLWTILAIVLINAIWSATTGRQLVGAYVFASISQTNRGQQIGSARLPARWICFLASLIPGILVATTAILGNLTKNADLAECATNSVMAGCETVASSPTNLLAVAAVASLAWLVFWIDTQVLKIPNQLTILLTLEIFLFTVPAIFWPNLGQITEVLPGTYLYSQVAANALALFGGATLWLLTLAIGGKNVGKGDLKLAPALGVLAASTDAKGAVSGLVVTAIAGIVNLPLKLRSIPYGPPLLIGALFGALT